MNIENMRAFLEIASTGSFQVAAERLHITQSTISARIKMLEQRLNRSLYLRKRSGIELTDAGSNFLRHAQSCVQSWERAQQEVALPDEFDNLISLGIQSNYWQRLVVPWTGWMQQQAPQYATKIISDYSEKLLSLVRDGMLDLALVYNVRHQASVNIEQAVEDELILVSGKSALGYLKTHNESGCMAWLMDREGNVKHVWTYDPEIWGDLQRVRTVPGMSYFAPSGLHLYEDGGLLVNFTGRDCYPPAIGIA